MKTRFTSGSKAIKDRYPSTSPTLIKPSTSTNTKLPLRCTAMLASRSGRPMKMVSAKTPATATDPVISFLPISTLWPTAFMFADQMSDFMPR